MDNNDNKIQDYNDIGLDKHFHPLGSPVTKTREEVLSPDFDLNYYVPYGKINYTNLNTSARPYTAVLSLAREKGAFTNLQEAINFVSRQGGGVVFIRNGQYTLNSNIILPSSVSLTGETPDGAILDFNNQAYQIQVQGSLVYNTGTASVNNKSLTVTGLGTTWTAAMIGDFILLNGAFYEIANVVSGTSITLLDNFSGDNLSGATYYIAQPITNNSFSNLTIQNSTHANGAVYCQYALGTFFSGISIFSSTIGLQFVNSDGGTFDGTIFDGCGAGMVFNNSANSSIDTLVVNNCTTGDGLACTSVNAFSLFNFGIFNSAGRGVVMTSSFNYGIINFAVLSNTGIGIELVSTNDGNILSGDLLNNTTDAVKLTSSCLRNTITNLVIRNNGGWGINVANANDTDNLIIGNTLRSNTSGSVTNSGTTTLIRSNIGAVDN